MNCKCDEQLAYTLSSLATGLLYHDGYFGQFFDHATECKVSNGGNGSVDVDEHTGSNEEHECCGSYPKRFEFSTQGGARSCCSDVTYSSNKHDCCDGSLKDLGTCATVTFGTDEEGSGSIGR